MTIKEARQFAGMTIKEVSDLTGIPYRSLQNWEGGVRQPPEYVEEYLIQKLCQQRQVMKILMDNGYIKTYYLQEDGRFEIGSIFGIENGRVSADLILEIGRATEAGFKILYI